MMKKCSVCNKRVKEDTDGNVKFCQGHSQSELTKIYKLSLQG